MVRQQLIEQLPSIEVMRALARSLWITGLSSLRGPWALLRCRCHVESQMQMRFDE
jgi:hypothetical protein